MSSYGFFPSPYPDECLYSILCRYYVRGAIASHQKVNEKLFGNHRSIKSSVYIPRRLHLISQCFPKDSGITRKLIVDNHTMYPYLSIFYSPDLIARMDNYINSGEPDNDFEFIQIRKSMKIGKDYLSFCPECVIEDDFLYGETYWHRLHQIQGVLYCPKHQVRIENSSIAMKHTSLHFQPASKFATTSECSTTDAEEERFKEQYIKLACDIEWLLKYGLSLGGARTIGEKYKDMYMEKGGIATINGRVFRNRFAAEISNYYGEDFLSQVLSFGGYVKNWDSYAVASRADSMRPLHQLLIMNFLCGSPNGFRDSRYKNAPYGYPPWPCINRHCSHFGMDGVDSIEFEFDYHCYVGYFQCKYCGMTYRRRTPDHSFNEYIKYATIVDYGHLWENKLRECIFEKKMIQKELAMEMGVSLKGLKSAADKVGLDINTNAKIIPNRNPGGLYKAQVLELLEKQPELSSNDLRCLLSRTYSWLIRHDPEWLKNFLTPEKQKAQWKEKDERLTLLFQTVYADLQKYGNTKRRVTIGFLCALAGMAVNSVEQQRVKNQLNLLPNLKRFMDSVLETEDKWIARRVTEIHLRYKEAGRKLRITHVRKDISVRNSKFNLYKNSILALIDELNSAD